MDTRRYLFFSWFDFLSLFGLLFVITALVVFPLHCLARRSRGRSDAWLSPLFFALGIQIISNLCFNQWRALHAYSPLISFGAQVVTWAVGAFLFLASFRSLRLRNMASAGWRIFLALSPILVIIPAQLVFTHKWAPPGDNPSNLGRVIDHTRPPIVVFLFDTVGYDEVFEPHGAVKTNLPGFHRFSETATIFHRAKAAYDCTGVSVPSLMLQEEVEAATFKGTTATWQLRSSEIESWFTAYHFTNSLPFRARQTGGRSIYAGIYLPFDEMMPSHWDRTYIHSFYGAATTPAASKWFAALCHWPVRFIEVSKDPFSFALRMANLHVLAKNMYWRAVAKDLDHVTRQYLESSLSPGDFLFIHCPLPHSPFVFAPDGSPSKLAREEVVQGYADQLRYSDVLLSDWMNILQRNDKWDDSWIIVTSDHANIHTSRGVDWDYRMHVPLLIKRPKQSQREDVLTPFRHVDLHQLDGFPL